MNKLSLFCATLLCALLMFSCEDSTSAIGGSLTTGEVSITVDSLPTNIASESIYYDSFDGRNITKLIGRINVPEYGSLNCSFVSQMLSATSMSIPDSITVNEIDSCRMLVIVPTGALTGDSLAPQQMKVFKLNRQLPADISSSFNPDGYYNPSTPMGVESYTLSNIAGRDSVAKASGYIKIPVKLPTEFAVDLFNKYRANDPIFQWPSTFNQYFPGVYVEQNFGNGCIAKVSGVHIYTYWHYTKQVSQMQPDSTYKKVDVIMRDSIGLLSSQPEVLSSNIIRYKVSQKISDMVDAGKSVITTPGGYMVSINFPIRRLLDEYHGQGDLMSTVSSLRMEIPASEIENEHGISVAPYLLMVRKKDFDSFFKENKLPDGKTSFYAAYNSESKNYQFNSMRQYFLDVLEAEKNGETIDGDETEFVLVPVDVTTETVNNYYGTPTVYVTKCQPYLTKPTMTQLFTDRTIIVFTYSTQIIE